MNIEQSKSKVLGIIDHHTLKLAFEYGKLKRQGLLEQATPEQKQANALYSAALRHVNQLRERYNRKRANARNHSIPFYLSFEEYVTLVDMYPFCPITGVKLDHSLTYYGRGTKRDFSSKPALDRIDNTKPYTFDNCWFISHRMNFFKGNLSLEELKAMVNAIEQRLTYDITPVYQ